MTSEKRKCSLYVIIIALWEQVFNLVLSEVQLIEIFFQVEPWACLLEWVLWLELKLSSGFLTLFSKCCFFQKSMAKTRRLPWIVINDEKSVWQFSHFEIEILGVDIRGQGTCRAKRYISTLAYSCNITVCHC